MTGTRSLLEMALLFFLVGITPGPSMLLGLAVAAQKGPAKAAVSGAGLLSGLCIYAFLSILGLGVLVLAVPGLMDILRIAGILYLAWLGCQALWRAWTVPRSVQLPVSEDGSTSIFRRGFFVALTNPKAILFFGGVFPQFIPAQGLLDVQALVAVTVFAVAWSTAFAIYAVAGSMLRRASIGARSAVIRDVLAGTVYLSAAAILAVRR